MARAPVNRPAAQLRASRKGPSQRRPQGDTAMPAPPMASGTSPFAEVMAAPGLWAQHWQSLQYNPAELIWKRGMDVYDIMLRDDQIKAAMKFKCESILASGWSVSSPEGRAPDWDVTAFVRARLSALGDGFNNVLRGLLTALTYGYAIAEQIYEPILDGKHKGLVGIKAIKAKAPHKLRFLLDAFANVIGVINDDDQKTYPRDKFVIWTFGDSFGNPYGQSDLEACYRAYVLADNSYKWLGMYMERLGIPPWLFLYNPEALGDPKQQGNLQRLVKTLQAATSAAIPRPSKEDLEIWTPGTASNVQQVFIPAIGMLKSDIARALLMPGYLGVTPDQTTGSLARARVALDMFLLSITSNQGALRSVVQHQIVEPLCDMNFVTNGEYPHFDFLPLGEEDIKGIVDAWVSLVDTDIVSADDDDEQHLRGLLKFPRSEPDEEPNDEERKPRIPLRYLEKLGKAIKVDELRTALGLEALGGEEGEALLEEPPPAPIVVQPSEVPPEVDEDGNPVPPKPGGGQPGGPGGAAKPPAKAGGGATPKPGATAKSDTAVPDEKKPAKNAAERGYFGRRLAGDDELPLPEIHQDDIDVTETPEPPKPDDPGLTTPERRCKFAVIVERLDGLEDELVGKITPQLRTAVAAQIELWRKRPPTLARAAKVTLKAPPKVRALFLAGAKKALGFGRSHCRDEANMAPALAVARNAEAPTFSPEDALAYLESKADFFVTGLDAKLTEIARGEIMFGLRNGLPFTEVAARLYDALAAYIGPKTGDPAAMRPDRLLTTVRTNATDAYNQGRVIEAKRLGQLGLVTGMQHTSQMDSRTSDICRKMQGRCYRIDDPALDRYTPPLHMRCRSILIPIMMIDDISDDPKAELHWATPEELAEAARLVPGEFGGSFTATKKNAPKGEP